MLADKEQASPIMAVVMILIQVTGRSKTTVQDTDQQEEHHHITMPLPMGPLSHQWHLLLAVSGDTAAPIHQVSTQASVVPKCVKSTSPTTS
jgi:hypothetical protein